MGVGVVPAGELARYGQGAVQVKAGLETDGFESFLIEVRAALQCAQNRIRRRLTQTAVTGGSDEFGHVGQLDEIIGCAMSLADLVQHVA